MSTAGFEVVRAWANWDAQYEQVVASAATRENAEAAARAMHAEQAHPWNGYYARPATGAGTEVVRRQS